MKRFFTMLLIFLIIFLLPAEAFADTIIRNAVLRNVRLNMTPAAAAPDDPCAGKSIGQTCACGTQPGSDPCTTGFALYAGTWQPDGAETYHYMTTPGGCNNATCAGFTGTDNTSGRWASGAPASNTKIIASPSTVYGGAQSAIIAATAGSVAAKFCEDLTFGGFTDWYLPAASAAFDCENYSGEMYNVLYKNSDQYRPNNVGCAGAVVAGPLTGFGTTYWTSTEIISTNVVGFMSNMGIISNILKTSPVHYLRCIRRY